MGAKDIYTDMRNRLIMDTVLSNDVQTIKELLKDRDSFHKFVAGWQRVNLDEFINKFIGEHNITADDYNLTYNLRKISFWDDGKEYEIVCAMGGKYFRIQRQPYNDSKGRYHGKEYVGLNLKSPSIPGTFQGKARKAELNRLTHFAMTFKKGTV